MRGYGRVGSQVSRWFDIFYLSAHKCLRPLAPLLRSCNMLVHALLQGDWMKRYQGRSPVGVFFLLP